MKANASTTFIKKFIELLISTAGYKQRKQLLEINKAHTHRPIGENRELTTFDIAWETLPQLEMHQRKSFQERNFFF